MTSDNSINIKLPPIAPLFTILGWYWIFLKISWNYIKRPKIEIKFGDVANLTILKNQSQILFQFKILKNFVRNSSRF